MMFQTKYRIKFFHCCILAYIAVFFHGCFFFPFFRSSSSIDTKPINKNLQRPDPPAIYGVRYAYVQSQEMFNEEYKDILTRINKLSRPDSYDQTIDAIEELQYATGFKVPDMVVSFSCYAYFQKDKYTDSNKRMKLYSLLEDLEYPCKQRSYNPSYNKKDKYNFLSTRSEYDEYYVRRTLYWSEGLSIADFFGERYRYAKSKEDFLSQYTKHYDNILTKEQLIAEMKSILSEGIQTGENSNALYDLQELKHYAFNKKLISGYQEFYNILAKYPVQCKAHLFSSGKTDIGKVLNDFRPYPYVCVSKKKKKKYLLE